MQNDPSNIYLLLCVDPLPCLSAKRLHNAVEHSELAGRNRTRLCCRTFDAVKFLAFHSVTSEASACQKTVQALVVYSVRSYSKSRINRYVILRRFVDLLIQDRELIQVTMDFANLDEIGSTDQIGLMFQPVVRAFTGDKLRVIRLLRSDEIHVFERNQVELKSWLDRIIDFKRRTAKQKRGLETEVANRLGNVETRGVVSFHEGRLQRQLQYRLSGVQACYGYATALLLDERNGLLNRIGKCRECGMYFVDFPKGRARPRVLYCSTLHNNRHRSRRNRLRKTKQRTKDIAIEVPGSEMQAIGNDVGPQTRKRIPKTGKPEFDEIQGSDWSHDRKRFVSKHRIVDKKNDRYIEKVVDDVTGEVIVDCYEPLSQHKGHGSAKSK